MIDKRDHTGRIRVAATGPLAGPVRTLGVVGAGMMGRSIAVAAAQRGLRVWISDANSDVLQASVAECRRALELPASRNAVPTVDLRPVESGAEWAECDLVIEAVLEKLAVKRRVLARMEPRLNSDCVMASNTSSLRIADIAAALKHPGRLCGLHFLHPVAQRHVVEVVSSQHTSPQSLARAMRCVSQLGKTAIPVQDRSGFVVNRLLMSYLVESMEMLTEGATMATVEKIATHLGMPIGPLAQIDQIGVDVVARVGASFRETASERPAVGRLLMDLYDSGRWGCKTGCGFYRYPEGRGPCLDFEILPTIMRHVQRGRVPSHEEIRLRLGWALVLEASRVLHEEVVGRMQDIDLATRGGLGFTGEIACVFEWARRVGVDQLLGWCHGLRSSHPHLLPSNGLRAMLQGSVEGLSRAA
jgi:3-hydroxyacyl-CoA dehydrogenase/enoyl-CoA hydratase/3-hydroxybutyryl-CoA epimerase/enoyl-CoA isomerase